ncbi:hypothetical protein TNCV_2858641 [Trichonephila clavipes]|nr:hypothetical protein TNCV_2858641 [Trichonephila clavipes]
MAVAPKSPLVGLVEEEERWDITDHPQGYHPRHWGGTEPNHTVICMVFKTTDNDRRTISSFFMLNFVGFVLTQSRSGGFETRTTQRN